jgi:hypothetical protein
MTRIPLVSEGNIGYLTGFVNRIIAIRFVASVPPGEDVYKKEHSKRPQRKETERAYDED